MVGENQCIIKDMQNVGSGSTVEGICMDLQRFERYSIRVGHNMELSWILLYH
jgi:hypothetical protein